MGGTTQKGRENIVGVKWIYRTRACRTHRWRERTQSIIFNVHLTYEFDLTLNVTIKLAVWQDLTPILRTF